MNRIDGAHRWLGRGGTLDHMTAEPLPADIMEWMGMDESMVEFALDVPEDVAAVQDRGRR